MLNLPPLVSSLFGGPLAVIGDMHGEIEPLRDLLGRLGFDPQAPTP